MLGAERRQVLVVEDDERYARVVVQRALRKFPIDLSFAFTNWQVRAMLERGFVCAGATIDLELPDGDAFDTMSELRKRWPRIEILALTAHFSEALAERVASHGAVYAHKSWRSFNAVDDFAERLLQNSRDSDLRNRLDRLQVRYGFTDRDREILARWLQGEQRKEIGAALGISPKTVATHLSNVAYRCRTPLVRLRAAVLTGVDIGDGS